MVIIGGNSVPNLVTCLSVALDIPVLSARVEKFKDGEIDIELLENVRGTDVFVVQSVSQPTNDNLMELLLIADAAKRASARSITAVVPYLGYARQDRRVRSARVPISARVVANMLTQVGIGRLLTIDLHSEQIQGFFEIPVDNVYGTPVLIDYIRSNIPDKPVIVSPDIGGVVRARAVAKRIHGADLAIIDKRRSKANHSEVMHLIGDVEGRVCILIDDIVDTAGTLCQAAASLHEHGASKVCAYATHPVLSGDAVARIEDSLIDALVVTDTIGLSDYAIKSAKIHQVSIANLLTQAITRIGSGESVSALFQ